MRFDAVIVVLLIVCVISPTHSILLLKWWHLVQFYHGDDCGYGLFRNATATIQVFSVSLSLKVRCLWLTFSQQAWLTILEK